MFLLGGLKIYWCLVHVDDEMKILHRSKENWLDELLEFCCIFDCLDRGMLRHLSSQSVHDQILLQKAANHHPTCHEGFLLHDRQQGASLDDDLTHQYSKAHLPPLKDPFKEGVLHLLKLTTRAIMTRIAGELLDIEVVEALTKGTPMNDKRMQNADGCSSRPIGDPSIPFNATNLGNNGNLILGRVTSALNTRNTPRWTEKD